MSLPNPLQALVSTLCVLGLVPVLQAASSSPALTPAAGHFLVAGESLKDPNFAQTVVLLLHHDDDGSVGLIVNQHSDLPPAQLLPGVRGLDRYRGNLFLGGPVELSHVSVLANASTGGAEVLEGVYLSNDPQTLEALLRAGSVGEGAVRIFIGYAGWAPGQLAAEIAAGGWSVHAASASDVFKVDPSRLWGRLRQGPGGQAAPDEPFTVQRRVQPARVGG